MERSSWYWCLWLVLCLANARGREQSDLLARLLLGGCAFCRLLLWAAPGESELSNAALVEMPEAEFLHLLVLRECGGGEGQVELRFFPELQGDAAVFRRMIGAEETGVIPIHHIF